VSTYLPTTHQFVKKNVLLKKEGEVPADNTNCHFEVRSPSSPILAKRRFELLGFRERDRF
jgi:hypothetical protein